MTAAIPHKAPERASSPASCENCGNGYVRKRQSQQFCGNSCKASFQNRMAVEGRAVVALAKAWRASRNRKADKAIGTAALRELASILDDFNAADRDNGRPGAMSYVARMLADGRKHIDRKPWRPKAG